ncbi:MAG TPA: lipase family protein [Anaerolineales bacterium]|nr:lipase family protein [Anaerolineales bacterium]
MPDPRFDKELNAPSTAHSLAREYFKVQNDLLSPPIVRAAYSDRMAWILASMAHLAYDKFENEDALELLKVKLESGGFELVETFNSKETDTQAFLTKNTEFAVLAFRGTEVNKLTDIRIDVRASKASVLEGRLHSGFRLAYDSVAKDIEKNVLALGKLPLYITGHSLGAALATVATQRMEHNPRIRQKIAACYTFGSPRVGNNNYDRDFKSPIYRVVNTTDIVTVVPLLTMGYIHIGDVRFLGSKDGDFRRGIPILRRMYFFFLTLLKSFSPVVGDHAIVEYRRKLEAIAQKRNPRFGH